MGFDAADEVARHGLGQAVPADEHVHPLRGLREEHGRLTRGVCAAHDGDLLIRAQLRLHRGGGVVHAGALEARQVLNRQAPVLDSTRDDDGTGEQGIAGSLAALHAVRLRAAVEPGDLSRDEDLRAELLRLIVGASRQLLAGDAEREAEIVLDARAGPRLPARCVPFDQHDVQAFRRRVHGRAEAGGSRADDDEVADRGPVDLGIQPETVGDLLDRGIAQHQGATADHHWDVAGAHLELIEHRLAVGVRIQIDELVGVPVAREELADLQRPLAMIRSEQQHVAEALIDQLQAAQDERAEENVAQLGIGLDELEQLLARDLDDVRRRARLDAGEEAPARQDRPLAREHPLTEARHVLARPAGRADEVEPSRDAHEDLGHRFACFAEDFARLDLAPPAVGFDAGDLRSRQSRKGFGLAGDLGRRDWSSWGGGHDLNTIPQRKSFRTWPNNASISRRFATSSPKRLTGARNVFRAATSGCTCGSVLSAGTSAAATTRSTGTPRSISIRPNIRSCAASSRVRTGDSVLSTSSCSSPRRGRTNQSGRRGWRRNPSAALSIRMMYARIASLCSRRGSTKWRTSGCTLFRSSTIKSPPCPSTAFSKRSTADSKFARSSEPSAPVTATPRRRRRSATSAAAAVRASFSSSRSMT